MACCTSAPARPSTSPDRLPPCWPGCPAAATVVAWIRPARPCRRFRHWGSLPRAPGPGLHVHDLRHTGNQFAANNGAALKDLMTRMGHDSERAALIYQHEARGADQRITDAIDTHVQAEQAND